MFAGFSFVICAALAALNFGLYAAYGDWWSLAAGIFAAFCALFNLALAVDR